MTDAAPAAKTKFDPLILTLIEPIVGHTVIREVRLRRPKASEILEHGFPYTVQNSADGRPIFIENDAAIGAYAETCFAEGQDEVAILSQLSMEDTLELRDRIVGFFIAAQAKRRAFDGSSTASSSASNGSPTSSSD